MRCFRSIHCRIGIPHAMVHLSPQLCILPLHIRQLLTGALHTGGGVANRRSLLLPPHVAAQPLILERFQHALLSERERASNRIPVHT